MMQELIAAIAAGGWVVIVVVLVICMIGLLIASPFGIFFSDGGGSPDAASPTAVIAQINSEYADRLSALQAGGTYDRVEIQGRPPSWADVFAVFAAKTASGSDGVSVAVLDTATVEKLRTVMVILDAVLLSISPLGIQHLPNLPAWVAVQVDGEESVRFFFVEDVSDTVRQRPLPGQNFCDGDLCRLPSQKIRATSLRGGSQMNRYSMPNSLHRFSNLAFSFSFTALERSFMQW